MYLQNDQVTLRQASKQTEKHLIYECKVLYSLTPVFKCKTNIY